jgi:hypothetical protein
MAGQEDQIAGADGGHVVGDGRVTGSERPSAASFASGEAGVSAAPSDADETRARNRAGKRKRRMVAAG